jgi:uncharacterized protein YcbK (DUF882 family)
VPERARFDRHAMSIFRTLALSRRAMLGAGANLGLVLLAGGASAAAAAAPALDGVPACERCLTLYVPHLDERFSGPYRTAERYLDDALQRVSWLMRDSGAARAMPVDPALLDILWHLGRRLERTDPIEILSGYRTPETNQRLRLEGAARNSFHLTSRAADIRVPGVPLETLNRAAVQLGRGGVGCYPHEDFVHLDTGPPRTWVSSQHWREPHRRS